MTMRTTLEIDDDVLLAAKELARRSGTTPGRAISTLLRQALTQPAAATTRGAAEAVTIHGFEPFPARGTVVTNELVEQLREQEGV
jgi:predicted transcriptional regulator